MNIPEFDFDPFQVSVGEAEFELLPFALHHKKERTCNKELGQAFNRNSQQFADCGTDDVLSFLLAHT
jgi:hypothetical protein